MENEEIQDYSHLPQWEKGSILGGALEGRLRYELREGKEIVVIPESWVFANDNHCPHDDAMSEHAIILAEAYGCSVGYITDKKYGNCLEFVKESS